MSIRIVKILSESYKKTGGVSRPARKKKDLFLFFYSASVTLPHRLGSLSIFWLPHQAICGMYSVPGQG